MEHVVYEVGFENGPVKTVGVDAWAFTELELQRVEEATNRVRRSCRPSGLIRRHEHDRHAAHAHNLDAHLTNTLHFPTRTATPNQPRKHASSFILHPPTPVRCVSSSPRPGLFPGIVGWTRRNWHSDPEPSGPASPRVSVPAWSTTRIGSNPTPGNTGSGNDGPRVIHPEAARRNWARRNPLVRLPSALCADPIEIRGGWGPYPKRQGSTVSGQGFLADFLDTGTVAKSQKRHSPRGQPNRPRATAAGFLSPISSTGRGVIVSSPTDSGTSRAASEFTSLGRLLERSDIRTRVPVDGRCA